MTDASTAARAIEMIIEQGEGSVDDHPDSHWGRFTNISDGFARLASNPDFDPARPVADNPVLRRHADTPPPTPSGDLVNIITHPSARAVDELFNGAYETLMLTLFTVFSRGSKEDFKPEYATVALELMTQVIKPLGELMTQLPLRDDTDRLAAGPSFEWYQNVELLPHRKAAVRLISQRAARLSAVALDLRSLSHLPPEDGVQVLDGVGNTLARLSESLAATQA